MFLNINSTRDLVSTGMDLCTKMTSSSVNLTSLGFKKWNFKIAHNL